MKRYKIIPQLLLLAIVISFFAMGNFAHAQIPLPSTSSGVGCWSSPIDCTVHWVRGAIVNLIALTGSGVDAALKSKLVDQPVVESSWKISRDFANMFFIIALIIMAFATIFDISKYNFRTLIARFLVAALLINFSLVIGEIIIDVSQSLANVFLTSIGNVGDQIAQGADLSSQLKTADLTQFQAADGVTWGTTMTALVNIIMLSIVFFSLLVLLFFSIIRIPILWALLIVAPIAWILYILPTTNKYSRMWWDYFISWNIFAPVYLFFIYFGILFLTNKQSFISGGSNALVSAFSTSFQNIFFYVLIGFFLIGGAKVAMNISRTGGAGAVAGAISTRTWATARYAGSRIPFIPYRSGGKLGVASGRDAAGVYKEGKDYFKEKGFSGTKLEKIPIIGGYRGKEGAEDRRAQIAGELGIPGVKEKQLQRRIGSASDKFKNQKFTEEQLVSALSTGSLEEKIAASDMLKNLGRNLTGEEIAPLFEQYRSISPADAVRWVRGHNIDSLNKDGLDRLDQVPDMQLKQKISRIRAKRNLISDADSYSTNLRRFVDAKNEGDLVGFIGDSKEFIAELKKDDSLAILDSIPESFIEARKKFINQIAEKGFLDTERVKHLTGPGSVFESNVEIDKFLEDVKKTNPLDALERKQELGILKDQYTKATIAPGDARGLEKVLQQEFDTMGTEGLAKIKSGSDAKGNKFGLANPRLLDAFKKSLSANRRAAEKIKGLYMDPKFTNNAPLMGYLDNALQEVRLNSLLASKGVPFKDKIKEVTDTLIPQAEKAVNSDNKDVKDVAERALVKARRLLKDASNILNEIKKHEFVTETIKSAFDESLADAEVRLNNIDLDNQKKPSGKASQPNPKEDTHKSKIVLTPGAKFEMGLSDEERKRRGY